MNYSIECLQAGFVQALSLGMAMAATSYGVVSKTLTALAV
jgi:Kef-type K+ transport system membrane component KefB